VLVPDSTVRRNMLAGLRAAGIGATTSYPACLADVPELKEHLARTSVAPAGGRYVADHIVTLPTHAFVAAADIAKTIEVVASSAREASIVPGWAVSA
jgi:hypothetical protein